MLAYLNELSLPKHNSDLDVINSFSELGKCYYYARNYGIKEIKIQDAFFSYQFSSNYTFYNWLADKRADEDLRTLFKSVFGSIPSVDIIFENYQKEHDKPLNIKFQNQPCIGLGLCSNKIFDTVCFSFNPENWPLPNYTVSVTAIVEDANGDLIELVENADAKNISIVDHIVTTHRAFFNKKTVESIPNGTELWLNRNELFPNLEFCASVKSQIEYMNSQDLVFQQILNRLFDLQNTAINFNGNPIEPEHFPTKTTPESAGRIQKFSQELTFTCPDGQNRLFSWHSRYTPGPGRVHFIPFENQNRILIGYVGKKIQ